ncbi:MAG: hypothetical protein CL561_10440 [Alphaproteobacteria bacterium]|nr:hypothetical protein [Alphaproteobacteria bacterium]|tara:strand:+ start:302416 stop:304656 length:2241 start_codon:yes stop_codon:yes gene_type:complete
MNKTSLYVPVYSLTLILSAVLLFSVQPMFSKMILPLLGGTSQVWNTSMLFFQLCLLAGYAYAHGTTKLLSAKLQAIIHVCLVTAFIISLPFGVDASLEPPYNSDPTFWQIGLMLTTIGGPFFLVSATAPMLQSWFTHSDHKDAHNPYFLYSASNFGSVAALLAYPVLIEPLLNLHNQTMSWMYGYIILIGAFILCAMLIWKSYSEKQSAIQNDEIEDEETKVTWGARVRWLLLAFIPSSLMLGVTTHITTDIASAPLFWILPLTLYILTFVIVFARKPIISNTASIYISCLCIIITVITSIAFKQVHFIPAFIIPLNLVTFFFVALACHGSLVNTRPYKTHLTEFYLFMSAGGALGGFFNAIIAPQLMTYPLEYPLVLGLATYAFYIGQQKFLFSGLWAKLTVPSLITKNSEALCIATFVLVFGITAQFMPHKGIQMAIGLLCGLCLMTTINARKTFAFCAIVLLTFPSFAAYQNLLDGNNNILVSRNFFGVKRITENNLVRTLFHGTTQHGNQPVAEEHKLVKTGYYAAKGPFNDAFNALSLSTKGQHNVAILGLGIGVMACYTQPQRHYDFYEIDVDVIRIAEDPNYFTYLSDCGSEYTNHLGDGRIEISKQPDEKYKMIVVDTFSSDNIPVHLITLDAARLYQEKLQDDGVLVFHISNRFLDLEPVMHTIGEALGLTTLKKYKDELTEIGDTKLASYPAQLVIMTNNEDYLTHVKSLGWNETNAPDDFKVWTDNYSNILSVLR